MPVVDERMPAVVAGPGEIAPNMVTDASRPGAKEMKLSTANPPKCVFGSRPGDAFPKCPESLPRTYCQDTGMSTDR